MWLFAGDFQAVFWIAVIPAFLSVAVLVAGVREPAGAKKGRAARVPLHRSELARLGRRYWAVVAVAAVFSLARFSEGFLLLRAQELGISVALVPLVLVVMGVAYSLSSYPVGILSDRMDRTRLLMVGMLLLAGADIVLAFAPSLVLGAIGVTLWGLHMGFTQGILAALVADAAPKDLRGTAFGVLNLVTGVALLVASVAAGALWEMVGSSATFLAGAALALVALTCTALILRRSELSEIH